MHGRRPPRGIVLDMDSSVSPTHGEQEMSGAPTRCGSSSMPSPTTWAGKWPDQTLDLGLREVLVAVSTSRLSCKRAGENTNIDAGLGFIWRILARIRAGGTTIEL